MSGSPGVALSDLANFASNTANIDDIISLDITELGNDSNSTRNLDMNLLANQQRVSSSPKSNGGVSATPYSSSGPTFEINNPPPVPASSLGSGIEFINIEDTQKTVSVNTPSFSGTDTIQINRSNDVQVENLNDLPLSSEPGPVSVPRLSPEQEATEKAALLNKLRRLQTKGVEGAKMNMTNSLDEIKAEYTRLSDSAGLEKSIKFQRQMLVTAVTGLEFLNQRFNPVDVNLEGWSESVNENQDDFDEIFEELYDKYKDRSKVAPEVRLVMTLGMSAAMCHITNTFFKSKMPGMDDILKRNPDLARQFAQAAASQAVGPGFANFMSMGQPGGGREAAARGDGEGRGPEPFGGSGGANMGWTPDEQPSSAQTARREMKGPSGVEDILKAFEAEDRGEPVQNGFIPPPRPDAADDNQSIFTSTTMNGSEAAARKSGRGGNRKAKPAATGASISLMV
jgi:Family of unknown function (DUF5767)